MNYFTWHYITLLVMTAARALSEAGPEWAVLVDQDFLKPREVRKWEPE